MNKDWFVILFKRFAKAFISGGLASVLVQLAQAPAMGTLEQWKTWLVAIGVAFVSGGILAVEKSLQGYRPQ